jgi:hypothetical protein
MLQMIASIQIRFELDLLPTGLQAVGPIIEVICWV